MFFIIFKGLSIKQTTQIFLEGESPTLNYFMFMFNSNEPIKVAHLQKLTNQLMSMLNGVLVIEMVNNFLSEEKKNFGRLIKRETF